VAWKRNKPLRIAGEAALHPWIARLFARRGSADPARLGEFLHARGAFVAQKTILDYLRVKAGRREREVFADRDFQAALEHCRWQVYLAALVDVTALAEAWLRPEVPAGEEPSLAEALCRLYAAALATEPPPGPESPTAEALGLAIRQHLAALQAAPPLPAHTRPMLAEAPLFATLPVAPEQRIGETPAIRGALRFHLVSTQQEMERAFDAPALARALVAATGRAA
jgi:hypothetical protein